MGLPYKHRLAGLMADSQPIPLSEIYPFWRINVNSADNIAYLPLFDPRMPEPRAPGALAASGSGNGGGSGGKKQKAPPKCSNCGEMGHTIRKCPIP